MGYARVRSGFMNGCDFVDVNVECHIGEGLPGFKISGMAESFAHESASRVRCACLSSGYTWPRRHVVVNLSPANISKRGTGFDLAIAAAVLAADGQIAPISPDIIICGELALSGDVVPMARGMLAVAGGVSCGIYASAILPAKPGHLSRDSLEGGVRVIDNIAELRGGLDSLSHAAFDPVSETGPIPEIAAVKGHDTEKRALQIAAAGGHNVLFTCPNDADIAHLASCLPFILPPMSRAEAYQTALIHDAGGLDVGDLLSGPTRPFRAPHHSLTLPGLLGGGNPIYPGEVSLAHNGVLFLEDIGEYSSEVLRALAPTCADKTVRITRNGASAVMPSDFILVGLAAPCPCGSFGVPGKDCHCSAHGVERYRRHIDKHVGNLFDLRVSCGTGIGGWAITTGEMRDTVMAARGFSSERNRAVVGKMEPVARDLLDRIDGKRLAGVDIKRIERVARTIADLDHSEDITAGHVEEAFLFTR